MSLMNRRDINFFFEEIENFNLNKTTVKWLKNNTLSLLAAFEINYIFCSDEYLLEVNKEYLNHDYYTDIITFNNSDDNSVIVESDIFISIDRVKDHASERSISFDKELCRVLIHGVLHLAGFNDKSSEEQLVMTQMEDKYLALHPDF